MNCPTCYMELESYIKGNKTCFLKHDHKVGVVVRAHGTQFDGYLNSDLEVIEDAFGRPAADLNDGHGTILVGEYGDHGADAYLIHEHRVETEDEFSTERKFTVYYRSRPIEQAH